MLPVLPLAAQHGSVVPVNLAAILDKGAVDGLAVPVDSDLLVAEELALRRHSLLVGESQVGAALIDRASIGTIAIAIPRALQVRMAMPVTTTAATSSTIVRSSPIRSVRPIDLPAIGAQRALHEPPLGCSDGVRVHVLQGSGERRRRDRL